MQQDRNRLQIGTHTLSTGRPFATHSGVCIDRTQRHVGNLFDEKWIAINCRQSSLDLTGRATFITPRTIGVRLSFRY